MKRLEVINGNIFNMQTQLVKIKDLKNNTGQIVGLPKNPRILKDDKFIKLKKSLQDDPEMLELREVIAYDNNGELIVICGNMRLKALNELGVKEVPTKILPNETSVEKLKAYTIKDNVSFGDHDWEQLSNEWDVEQLEEWGLDIQNFETDEVLEATEDDFDTTPPTEPITVLGDLYEIGEHRLLCGDSTDSDSVAKLMDGQKADMVFTDPPYGIAYDNTQRWDGIEKQNGKGKRNKGEMILGDGEPFDPSFLLAEFSYCKEIFIWGMQYYPDKLGRGGCIVWNRKTESQKDVPHADFELCWSKQERNKMAWITWGGFKSKEKGEERLHTTQKPIELAAWFLNNWGNTNDKVFDLFLGSGSTMVAANQLKRKCYGMELDPKYCDVIVKRMIKLDPTLSVKRNGLDCKAEFQ
jgi:DNA modification methylase